MKRALCCFLAVLLLLTLCMPLAAVAERANQQKREIAIVFDNSGSMYLEIDGDEDAKRAWCRATYAMEAFTAMTNESDVIQIYPMHPIQVKGKKYDSNHPLKLTQKDASLIREIYTPNPLGTPIESITKALNGLKASDAAEKWLIVLTDGATFYKNNRDLGQKTVKELEKVLTECNQYVNVMYLGIGSKAAKPTKVSGTYKYFAEKTKNSTEVLSKLTAMCNTIFGRDTLDVKDKKVSFDVSMKKLILFIQGKGIQNVSLGGIQPIDSNSISYSTKGGGGQGKQFLVDESLQGMMLTFENLPSGDYSISYDGNATSVVAYYEPDVDLSIVLTNDAGKEVDASKPLDAGSYTLHYRMVDREGKPVESKLLGETQYELTYSINGEEHVVQADKSGQTELELQPKDQLQGRFKVTYLSGYTIEHTASEIGWPENGITFNPPPAGYLKAEIKGGSREYTLIGLPKSETFRIQFTYNDRPCTSEQLERIAVEANVFGGKVGAVVDRDDKGFFVRLDYYEGEPLKTECGRMELRVSGVYTNEDDLQTNAAKAKARFKLVDNSSKLEMKLQADQTYYQLGQLKKSKPIWVRLSYSGKDLTDEQLKEIDLSCFAEGVEMIAEPVPGQSAFRLTVDPDHPPKAGGYQLTISAKGKNEIGKEAKQEGSLQIKFGVLPMWLKILIPILILLLIALLVFLFLNQKVLPKKISLREDEYVVDGDRPTGKAKATFREGGKKKGEMRVVSPKYSLNPQAETFIALSVEAVSPRYVKSADRQVRVTGVRVKRPHDVTSYTVGNMTYIQDPDRPGKFINDNGNAFSPMIIRSNSEANVVVESDEFSVFFTCRIHFE